MKIKLENVVDLGEDDFNSTTEVVSSDPEYDNVESTNLVMDEGGKEKKVSSKKNPTDKNTLDEYSYTEEDDEVEPKEDKAKKSKEDVVKESKYTKNKENKNINNKENKKDVNDILEEVEMIEVEENPNITKEEAKKSRKFLEKLQEYMKSGYYSKKSYELSKNFKVPQKKLAKGFASKVLGTIGDTLGIVIDAVKDVTFTVIEIIGLILTKGITLICHVAKAIVSMLTLNKTCIE